MQPSPPRYLRVVVTARCTLQCAFCHQEGDPATEQASGLSTSELTAMLHVAVQQGVRKLKFLGGEPLLRRDLPEIIASLRAAHPTLDLSLITGGGVPADRLEACFAAGLSRANLSIHGWSAEAFAARTGRGERVWSMRQDNLRLLLKRGRFLKLNFVWCGPQDDADLKSLLDWAADQPVVVGVLDNLGDPALGPAVIQQTLLRVRGTPSQRRAEPDPHSLPTLRLGWPDGLAVEVKDHHLGEVAPWTACATCPVRGACREGIHALRLSHDGQLRPCMDRPDLNLDLVPLLERHGPPAAAAAWACAVAGWQAPVRGRPHGASPRHKEAA